jgi:hypothetical protein
LHPHHQWPTSSNCLQLLLLPSFAAWQLLCQQQQKKTVMRQ